MRRDERLTCLRFARRLPLILSCWSQVLPAQTLENVQTPVREAVPRHSLVAPVLSFGADTVTPLRSKTEHDLAGNEWFYHLLFTHNPVNPMNPMPRAILRVARYRYSPAPPEVSEAYRVFLQTMLTDEILPAALQIPELASFNQRFTEIEAVIDDDSEAVIGITPWDSSVGPHPTITVSYELSHTLAHHAYLQVVWDRLMKVDRQNPEMVYAAFNGWLNAYGLLLISEYSQINGGPRLFDQGVIEALFNPNGITMAERGLFNVHTRAVSLAVLSHEACHHILNHRSDTNIKRHDIELAADICAARVVQNILKKEYADATNTDMRYAIYWTIARDLAQLSQLTWIAGGGENADDYPDSNKRYRAIIDAIPAEIVESLPPDFAAEMRNSPNPLLPESAMPLRNKLDEFAIFAPDKKDEAEAYLLDALWGLKDRIKAYCVDYQCTKRLASTDANTRYFSARALIDLAALYAELASDATNPSAMRDRARVLTLRADSVVSGMPVAHGLVEQVVARLDRDR